jgi:hypothetical protein
MAQSDTQRTPPDGSHQTASYHKGGKAMISDVLADALTEMQQYLNDPTYDRVYSGELRAEIERVIAEMQSLRERLDKFLPQAEQQDSG